MREYVSICTITHVYQAVLIHVDWYAHPSSTCAYMSKAHSPAHAVREIDIPFQQSILTQRYTHVSHGFDQGYQQMDIDHH